MVELLGWEPRARHRRRPAHRHRLRGGSRVKVLVTGRLRLRRAAPDPRARRRAATRSSPARATPTGFPSGAGVEPLPLDLAAPLDDVALPAVDAIVHLAQANVPYPEQALRALPRQHARDARAARCLRAHRCAPFRARVLRDPSTGSATRPFRESDPVAASPASTPRPRSTRRSSSRATPTCSTAPSRCASSRPTGRARSIAWSRASSAACAMAGTVTLVEGGRPRMNPIYVDDAVARDPRGARRRRSPDRERRGGRGRHDPRDRGGGRRGRGRRAGLRGCGWRGGRRRRCRHHGLPRVARRPPVRARSPTAWRARLPQSRRCSRMCGIAAVLDRSGRWVEQPELLRMTDAMRHRGPDDEGWYAGHGVGLGNRRLAIIDLTSGGHQPMSNEDGSVWITYNGELYNYRELRRELVAAGHRFRSRQRHRGHRARLRGVGRRLPAPLRRHVRVRDLGRAAEAPHGGARPLRRQAALLERPRRAAGAGLGAQGRAGGRRAAAHRRRGRRRVLHLPEPLLRPHAVRRRARAPGRLPDRGRRRRRQGAALVGLRVRPRRIALARGLGRRASASALEAAVDRQLTATCRSAAISRAASTPARSSRSRRSARRG